MMNDERMIYLFLGGEDRSSARAEFARMMNDGFLNVE